MRGAMGWRACDAGGLPAAVLCAGRLLTAEDQTICSGPL